MGTPLGQHGSLIFCGAKFMLTIHNCQNETENMRRNFQSPSTQVEPCNGKCVFKVTAVLAQGAGEPGDSLFEK
jgi:hypothetical protein